MTMGRSMALHDESVLDPHVGDMHWLDEDDRHVNPRGPRASATSGSWAPRAAIADAVYHATGIRVRELPIMLNTLLR
jgi:xanthine dehydrogenase YagR molybdenum-binding subunit